MLLALRSSPFPSACSTIFTGYTYALIAACLWGLSGVLAKSLFNNAFDPLALVTIRLTLSSLLLVLTLAVVDRHRLVLHRRHVLPLAILGLFGMATNQATYFYAISVTSVAVAIFLQYLAPVLVALYDVIVGGRRLSSWTAAALCLSLAGSALLLVGSPAGKLHVGAAGLLAGLGSACCFAFYTVWSNRYVRDIDPWTVLAYGLLWATLVWTILRPPWIVFTASYTLGTWFAFGLIAVFGTLLPFGCYLRSMRFIPPTHASITATLEPVVAGAAAFLVLGEALTAWQLLGAVCVGAGVVVVQRGGPGEPDQQASETA